MSDDLSTSVGEHHDGTAVLSVAGDIDMHTAATFAEAIRAAGQDRTRLLLDLTRVTYLDSAAIAVLFAHATGPTELEIVVADNAVVDQLVRITGLDQVATVRN